MEVIPLKFLTLILLFVLEMSFGKIVFETKKVFSISLVKDFFQESIIPDIKTVNVVNFGYDTSCPTEFQVLMNSLNENRQGATVVFGDYGKTTLETGDRVFLLILTKSQLEKAIQFIDDVQVKGLQSLSTVVLFSPDVTKEDFNKFYEKPKSVNFNQIIYAFPSFESTTNCMSLKGQSKTLVFYLEHPMLTKLRSTKKTLKFITDKDKINATLDKLRWQHKLLVKEINKYPIKVLIYLRPLSVEASPPNSSEPYIGVGINILKTLVDTLQSSYTLELGKPEEYGTYYANNTPTRAYTDVHNGIFDLSINRYLLMKSKEGMGVMPYEQDKFCFVMLWPENKLRAWSILMPFQTSVWLPLLLTNAAVYTTYMFIREKHWKVYWVFQSAISATHFPAKRLGHRIFWSSWLHFNLIINASYTCSFVTQLIRRQKQHPYKTLQHLISKNITLLTEVGHFQEIYNLFPENKLTPYYGEPQNIKRGSALLTSSLTRQKLFKLFRSRFYRVDECLLRRTVGPLMSPRNPNYKHTVRIVQQVIEAGLNQRWLEISLNSALLSRNGTNIDADLYEKNGYSPIKLYELENIFHCFIIGLALSSVMFLCEWILFEKTKAKAEFHPESIRVLPYSN